MVRLKTQGCYHGRNGCWKSSRLCGSRTDARICPRACRRVASNRVRATASHYQSMVSDDDVVGSNQHRDAVDHTREHLAWRVRHRRVPRLVAHRRRVPQPDVPSRRPSYGRREGLYVVPRVHGHEGGSELARPATRGGPVPRHQRRRLVDHVRTPGDATQLAHARPCKCSALTSLSSA